MGLLICAKRLQCRFPSLKNGEGDLVVMDIDACSRREAMLKLREELLAAEESRMHGSRGYSVDEAASMMREEIKEASGRGETK